MIKEKLQSTGLKWIFVVGCILFVLPSWIYFITNIRCVFVPGNLEFRYLMNLTVDRNWQTVIYAVIVTILVALYALIIKNRRAIFKRAKSVFIFVLLISLIFAFSEPFTSSDIFYYMGVGRLACSYGQNPYYQDLRSYVNENNIDISNDTVMQAGYINYWSNTTVVYGALWTIICTVLSFFSFGNLNLGILLFKMLNVCIHVLNCILIYKLSKKKIYAIAYGLNPFILIEGIMNVHNDMTVLFFILGSLYMIRKKKNIFMAIVCIAFATSVKYVAVFVLPIIILYHYRGESIPKRILKCVEWGLVYVGVIAITYIPYFRDVNVLIGIVTQQTRLAKGLYCTLRVWFPNSCDVISNIRTVCIITFVVLYMIICMKLLFNKKIKLYEEWGKTAAVLTFLLVLILTNFHPWYFIWLSAFMIWQKPRYIRLIVVMQIALLYANIVFLANSESYEYAPHFFGIFVAICIGYMIKEAVVCCRYRKKIMI